MTFLSMFRNWKEVEEFDPQAVIFSEGDPADLMYVILSGEVDLTVRGEPLGTEGEGSLIGEMAIIESATCSTTATARTRATLAKLDRGQFRKLVGESTRFSLHAMTVLANRLRAVDQRVISQLDR